MKLEAIGDVFTSLPLRVQAVVATETLALASCQLQTPFYPELVCGSVWVMGGEAGWGVGVGWGCRMGGGAGVGL